MLFNCFSCGKLVSLRKEMCPYCMVDLAKARQSVETDVKKKKGAHIFKKKHTFFSLLSR